MFIFIFQICFFHFIFPIEKPPTHWANSLAPLSISVVLSEQSSTLLSISVVLTEQSSTLLSISVILTEQSRSCRFLIVISSKPWVRLADRSDSRFGDRFLVGRAELQFLEELTYVPNFFIVILKIVWTLCFSVTDLQDQISTGKLLKVQLFAWGQQNVNIVDDNVCE